MGNFCTAFFSAKRLGVWLLAMSGLLISVEAVSGEEGEHSQGFYVDMAYQFLEADGGGLALRSPRDVLAVTKVWTDQQDNTHVRFRQMVDDLPVWGGEVSIHMRADGGVYNVNGNTVAIADGDMASVRLSGEDVVIAIRKLASGRYARARITTPELLVILVDGLPRKSYRVVVALGLKREFLFVDANNGDLIKVVTGSPTK